MRFDHLLLIGFGGPTRREEVRPFLERVARGTKIPEERLREVESHYEQTGGSSPYNQHAFGLRRKLQERLPGTPLFIGMRNWHPLLAGVLREINGKGLRRGLAIVLAPHRSPASFDRYLRSLEEARQEAAAAGGSPALRDISGQKPQRSRTRRLGAPGALELDYGILHPWYDHPLFIQAQAQRVREVWNPSVVDGGGETELIFTAHSIPEEMARGCRYDEEIRVSAQAVARELGQERWSVAYQSRSGDPRQSWLRPEEAAPLPPPRSWLRPEEAAPLPPPRSWLGPDVRERASGMKQTGAHRVVLVPIGFLFDHTEVLYDLDLDAKRLFEQAGVDFRRAPTVMNHPKFVEMLAQLVEEEQCR